MRKLIALAGTIATLAIPASASAAPPIFESSFGATVGPVTNSDDAATTVPMGTFSFPFYGVTHTGAETFVISSNGLIEIGAAGPDSTDNTPTGNDARDGNPKIAALWADFNPAAFANPPPGDGGSVFMNTFNDDGDAAIDRVVFTWDTVFFGCEDPPQRDTCRAQVQIQLLESGRIIFGYNGVLLNQARDNFNAQIVPLIAKGGFTPPPGFQFVPDPTGVDFSESVPFTGGDLIFEEFAGSPVHFDLDQSNLVFVPVDANSYSVSSPVDIAVSSTASTASAAVGDTVTFTHTVTNTGSVAATGIVLNDRLPTGASGSATTTAGSCSGGGPIGCAIGDLAPGASATVTTTATLGQAGSLVDRVDATTATPGDGHGNNCAQNAITVAETGGPGPGTTVKAPKQSIADALSKGIKLKVTCAEACAADAKVTGSVSTKKKITFGTGSAEVPAGGTVTVKVPLTKAARDALGPANSAKLNAKVTTFDEQDNTTTTNKSFKLK